MGGAEGTSKQPKQRQTGRLQVQFLCHGSLEPSGRARVGAPHGHAPQRTERVHLIRLRAAHRCGWERVLLSRQLETQRGGQPNQLCPFSASAVYLHARTYHSYSAAPPPLGSKVACSPAPSASTVMSSSQPRESETTFVNADNEEEEERGKGEGEEEEEEKAFSSESDQLIPHRVSTRREGEELPLARSHLVLLYEGHVYHSEASELTERIQLSGLFSSAYVHVNENM